jgi:phage repressor protein C with HTH and peptisase S24 domain
MSQAHDIAAATQITRRKRLQQLVDAHGGQSALATKISRDRNQVWQWLKADGDPNGRTMSSTSARAIEEALALPFGWLDNDAMAPVIGRGKAELRFTASGAGEAAPPAYSAKPEPEDDFVEVPVLGTVDRGADAEVEVPFYTSVAAAAGDGAHNGDQAHQPVKLRFRKVSLRRKGIDPTHARVIYVKGDSMEPLMSDGDQIMFDASRTAIRDGELYVIRVDRDEMVKRLHKRPGDRVVVQSENPAFAPYEVGLEDPGFAVLGQVVWRAGWM